MDITLVICAHNEASCIGETVAIAQKNSHGKFKEIIVVDNVSTDATAEIARSHGARVVFEPHKGLTSARQCGFEASQSELLAYIDADTHITPQWMGIAERTFNDRPDIVSLSGPRRYFGLAAVPVPCRKLNPNPPPPAAAAAGALVTVMSVPTP